MTNPSDPNPRRDGEEPTAPAKLVAALKEPPSRRVFVPPSVDEAILAAARRQFAPQPRVRSRFFRTWLVWPAFASAIVVVAGLGYLLSRPDEAARSAREDINRDGRVDILDAFQLARETQAGAPSPARDLNGDGVVDRRDAEFIATCAVSLEKGRKS
jgi:hypothetical protein